MLVKTLESEKPTALHYCDMSCQVCRLVDSLQDLASLRLVSAILGILGIVDSNKGALDLQLAT